jgi:OOP family OmpA-OmpF porin
MNSPQKNISRLLFTLLFITGNVFADQTTFFTGSVIDPKVTKACINKCINENSKEDSQECSKECTKEGYMLDERRNLIKNNQGKCWRSNEWTEALALRECDPQLFKKKTPVAIKKEPPKPDFQIPQEVPVPRLVLNVPKQTITLAADSLFDFNEVALDAQGMKQLDDLLTQMKGLTFDTITVIGHASRTAPAEHNRRLSVGRADSVKNYLVSAGKIDPDKINTEGKGSTQPVTKSGECKGNKINEKLRACLRPDQRVEVEVTGLK